MPAISRGLCRVTAKMSAEFRSAERLFESQKFGRSDVSPIVAVPSFTLAGKKHSVPIVSSIIALRYSSRSPLKCSFYT